MQAASPPRTATLLANLTAVATRVLAASSTFPSAASKPVRLVAVSKLKPASDILALYTHASPAQLHFGENYVQELLEKSRALPPAIRWHFIGGLQSNKCVSLARDTRGLWAVESVDTTKKASLLNKGWNERNDRGTEVEMQLRVFVQVNTSGEANKAGVEPSEVAQLCRFVRDECPGLKLQGLMTIGAIARSHAAAAAASSTEIENEDFVTLRDTRDRVVKELGLDGLELSMGMSADFEGAIALGSDQVRVGTTIFGDRPSKEEAKKTTLS
ncbi:hypothetical protein PISL3812_09844 [Talaromyces islandicus]|uniref:Pyridoxal phosphate homeostasis protein n=1 Tax=Talaromyces islandicus TaxID=28573 RepID=A0A0U1MAX6_TALIS|nr:hypothetical protein PISL3812_09844 [Talaromyces islandicus]